MTGRIDRGAYPLTDIEFHAWVDQADPGDRLIYHRGFLGIDTAPVFSLLPEPERERLCWLATAALDAFERDRVHLVQQRLGDDRFAYIAVARPKPEDAMPAISALPRAGLPGLPSRFPTFAIDHGEPAHALA